MDGNWFCNVIAGVLLWVELVNPDHCKFIDKSLAKLVVPIVDKVAPLLKYPWRKDAHDENIEDPIDVHIDGNDAVINLDDANAVDFIAVT